MIDFEAELRNVVLGLRQKYASLKFLKYQKVRCKITLVYLIWQKSFAIFLIINFSS